MHNIFCDDNPENNLKIKTSYLLVMFTIGKFYVPSKKVFYN